MALKRKSGSLESEKAKKLKTSGSSRIISLKSAKWKPMNLPSTGDWDGLLEVEELDGDALDSEHESATSDPAAEEIDDDAMDSGDEKVSDEPDEEAEPETFDPTLLPAWPSALHPTLLRSLHSRSFTSMTRIQKLVMSSDSFPVLSTRDHDVFGIAETGSGKTLAFGLPVLHSLLSHRKSSKNVRALIVTPTRELANQIREHLHLACSEKLSIISLTGGLSIHKQTRLLAQKPDIVIGTPGRLNELVKERILSLNDLEEVIFDEFDKLFFSKGQGWKEELENICRSIRVVDDAEEGDSGQDGVNERDVQGHRIRKWFFSATSGDEDIMVDFRRRSKRRHRKGKGKDDTVDFAAIIEGLPFELKEPFTVDATAESVQSEQDVSKTDAEDATTEEPRIVEAMIECLGSDKDVYLYVFHLLHSQTQSSKGKGGGGGKTIVFLNSVEGIRRLNSVMILLKVQCLPLHSGMDQKGRLKSLERFRSSPNSVLLTTDLSSRGLDLPSVRNVISWNVPASGEVYVHRKGRTSRGLQGKGFSCVFVSPEERGIWKGVLGSLGRSTPPPLLPIPSGLIKQAKPRIVLAKKIDEGGNQVRKENHQKKWEREAREALGVESASSDDDDEDGVGAEARRTKNKFNALKVQLNELLAERLMMPGMIRGYVTSGVRPLVGGLAADDATALFEQLIGDADGSVSGAAGVVGIGEGEGDAREKVLTGQRKQEGKGKKKRVKKGKIEEEEWGGIKP